jgi:type IV pilus assembly protein PilA
MSLLVQMNPLGHSTMHRLLQKGFALIELVIVVAILAVTAAIAVPNFIKFQARSKQSEARTNLRTIYTGQMAFFQERKRFSQWTGEIGFDPDGNNRYAYFLSGDMQVLQDRSTSIIDHHTTTFTGIKVDIFMYGSTSYQGYRTTACGTKATVIDTPPRFVAVAEGKIDADLPVDEWSIASNPRVFKAHADCTADGDNPAGEPANDRNAAAH